MAAVKWLEKLLLDPDNKWFVDEVYVPAGMILILVATCWIASR